MKKSMFFSVASLAAVFGFCSYQVVAANVDNAEILLSAEQQKPVQDIYKRQGEAKKMTENVHTSEDVKKRKYVEVWDKTKEVSAGAWDKTKKFSADAWDKTKEFSSEAWETTKEAAEDIHEALMCDDKCKKEHVHASDDHKDKTN